MFWTASLALSAVVRLCLGRLATGPDRVRAGPAAESLAPSRRPICLARPASGTGKILPSLCLSLLARHMLGTRAASLPSKKHDGDHSGHGLQGSIHQWPLHANITQHDAAQPTRAFELWSARRRRPALPRACPSRPARQRLRTEGQRPGSDVGAGRCTISRHRIVVESSAPCQK